jgi:hypothetical protein
MRGTDSLGIPDSSAAKPEGGGLGSGVGDLAAVRNLLGGWSQPVCFALFVQLLFDQLGSHSCQSP